MPVIEGTTYPDGTPERVIEILEAARTQRAQRLPSGGHLTALGGGERLHLHYGNPDTGEDWLELHDTEGYVGRTMGPMRVPILVYNDRCTGGQPILVHRIVRIRQAGRSWRELYRHPNYVVPILELRRNIEEWQDGPIKRVRVCSVSLMRHETGQVHSTWKTSHAARNALRRLGAVTPDRFVEATVGLLGVA